MSEAIHRIAVVLPEITPAKLANLRRARPLAALPRGTSSAKPTAHLSPPSDRPKEWWCWGPGPVNGRLDVFVATYFYEVRRLAAVTFHCEPGQVSIWVEP